MSNPKIWADERSPDPSLSAGVLLVVSLEHWSRGEQETFDALQFSSQS